MKSLTRSDIVLVNGGISAGDAGNGLGYGGTAEQIENAQNTSANVGTGLINFWYGVAMAIIGR